MLLHVCMTCCFRKHPRLYITTGYTIVPVLLGVSETSSDAQLSKGPLRQEQAPPSAVQARQGTHVQHPPVSATDAEVRLAQQMPHDCS